MSSSHKTSHSEEVEVRIAIAGVVAGMVEGAAIATMLSGNPYVAFALALGGMVLWFTLRAILRERNRG